MSDAPKPTDPEEIRAWRKAKTDAAVRAYRERLGIVVEDEAEAEAQPAAAPAETAPVEATPQTAAPAKAEAAPVAEATPAVADDPKAAAAAKREAAKQAYLARKAAEGGAPAPAPAVAAKPAPAKKAATKAVAKKAAAKRKAAPEVFEAPSDVTRREFLNLAWLGAMTLLTAQTLGVSVLFLFPNFKAGEFGGIFNLDGAASSLIPQLNAPPKPYDSGKFWLTNTDKGVYAIYKVCTHLGCLYGFQEVTGRFECPCHGSKFTLTGSYVAGPAPRSLDRFKIIATRPDGTVLETPDNGAGITLNGDETLAIDTGTRISLPGRVEV